MTSIRSGITPASPDEIARVDFMACWQPISTAPKDGTYVLVATGSGDWGDESESNPHIAQYDPGAVTGDWRIQLDGQHIDPTHWMPLPAPPRD